MKFSTTNLFPNLVLTRKGRDNLLAQRFPTEENCSRANMTDNNIPNNLQIVLNI